MPVAPTRNRPVRRGPRQDAIARPPEEGRLALEYREAAFVLNVHPNTVRMMVSRGDLPLIKIGARRLIPRNAVEALVAGAEATS